ncbi:MAG TPA: tRNA (adenosine(37)-N6)-threonylcarbamoyltransferase complex transferase subunit TsaD [Phycisphaerae bacterium]|nr:tRNA (adenosine(37)-N6)-threonylcarbamoyltransferase complex transferase subunit TsaD [Phycisphaerae bacterium]
MRILGIETSCDETCAAVVDDGRRVLSNVVATQTEIHRKYGGVVPEIASRAHLEALVPVVDEALEQAATRAADVDAVAVVHRPGLIGSLLLGVTAAKTLAWLHDVPLVGVNHIEAHIYAACLERDELPFPCIGLIVSGGHTSLYACDGPRAQTLLGATTDDAAGEAFDKVASILGLPYPGGPSIDLAAAGGSPKAVRFSRPWLSRDSFDFSFSGVKTAVLYHVRGQGAGAKARPTDLTEQEIADVAASFQECVVDVLVAKTLRAAEARGLDRIIVGGGVAANRRLRARFQEAAEAAGLDLILPEMCFCTDNAAMVAGLAYHDVAAGRVAGLDLETRA